MQADYMPLGWLASIIGGKIFYKFAGTRQTFEQVFSSLLKEINRYTSDEISSNMFKPNKPRPPPPSNNLNNEPNKINSFQNVNKILNGASRQSGS
jgi:hypothetical protein